MSQRSELNSYIARLQQRLRLRASLRGAAVFTGTALLVTVALVVALNHYAFPAAGVAKARWGLVATLALAAGLGLLLPLLRLTRARTVRRAEQTHPELEERLTTFHEREQENDPFLELLAADTLAHTQHAPASSLAPSPQLLALGGAGLACLGVLVWTIASAPGYIGYGASLLWTGPKKNAVPLYAIAVKPGDVAVRRNSDQLITAQLTGLHPDKVQLFAHYASAAGWEPVAMQALPDSNGSGSYQFVFTGLPENVEYYVAAGPLTSSHYKVRVVDLPSVKEIRVTYHYPKWTGMKPVVEEHSGDLRAIEGTDASIEVETDKPLKDGELTLDGGKTIHLTAGEGNRYQGSIHMDKDGAYHLAATDQGQAVRLSEDYFIATDKAQPPQIALDRPGRDYRASPIEEVKVGVKAAATFGLNDVHLHYSVNGGADHDISMLKTPGAKDSDGNYTLHLEDFKMVPGDLVSVYATAKDGHAESRTDITFIQADPFEREFSQSQQSGGAGGGGGGGNQNNQTDISKREKELIAATWKQQNDKNATPKDNATQGQFLADAQHKLRDQVMALSARMQTRDLSQANEEFNGFEKDMQTAAQAMAPSADKLKATQWKDALPLEQKALQALLRAEATFRQIEVAFGQRGGGGGGGSGSNSGRDLASLFDLEMDTEKNQYETAQTASPQEQHAKDVEDALEKLDALAKRQEELASQQHNPQQSFQERWQQEMLRREAEQLQRQMEQLAQNKQGQQDSQGQQAQQGQQGEQGQQSNQQGQQNSQSQQASNGQQSGSQQQSGSSSSSGQPGSQSSSQSSSQSASSQYSQEGSQLQRGSQSQSGSPSGSQQASNSAQGQRGGQRADARSGQAGKTGQAQHDQQAQQDQRVEEALSRLRQAGDAMKRSGSAQQNGSDTARQAADRLREATNLLGGEQQQLATGKLDSLTREAGRLTQEEQAQADRINKLANQHTDYNTMTAESMQARLQERDQLASERQRLSDDLSRLQKNVRDSAREMASNQPGAAQKLRDALTQMDQTDLDNHVQRTADWLRRGINPNSNGTETEIAQGLQKLNQQLHEAQGGMGQGKPDQRSTNPGDQVAALGQAERLRQQLQAMASSRNPGNQQGQPNGQRGTQPGSSQNGQQTGSNQQARNGQQAGSGQQPGNGQQAGNGQRGGAGQQGSPNAQGNGLGNGSAQQAGNRSGQPGGNGFNIGGDLGGTSGDVRVGGGGRNNAGAAWNTGNNRYGQATQRPVPLDASGNPADTERNYQQGMRELSQLRQMVKDDPQAAREVQDIAKQMQQLDPSRFPGNPAMVEHMHQEMLSAVDRLEIQLDRNGATEAKTGKPSTIPTGYQDSVAEYYKRLSSKQ